VGIERAFALVALTGCSLLTTRPQPALVAHPELAVDCTETYAPAIGDTIVATGALGTAAAIGIMAADRSDCRTDCGAGAAALAVGALAFGLSAYHGYDVAAECKRAVGAHDAWMIANRRTDAPRAPVPHAVAKASDGPSTATVLIVSAAIVGVIILGAEIGRGAEGFHL